MICLRLPVSTYFDVLCRFLVLLTYNKVRLLQVVSVFLLLEPNLNMEYEININFNAKDLWNPLSIF